MFVSVCWDANSHYFKCFVKIFPTYQNQKFQLTNWNYLNWKKWKTYLLKVVEVLVHPVLKNIENSELDRLTVLLPEPLHVLGNLDLRLLVDEFRIGLGIAWKFGLGNVETLKEKDLGINLKFSSADGEHFFTFTRSK